LGYGVLEHYTSAGDAVYDRCLDLFVAVAAEVIGAKSVHCDEDDV